MKITQIEIYGYGKFVQRQFKLDNQFNVFLGNNGAGKSTLMSFILSIMFGFPNTRRKNNRNFDTNPQVTFGGRIFFEDTPLGECVIERTKAQGHQQLYLTLTGQEKEEVSDFDRLFGNLKREDYLAYFGFTEPDLMQFIWESEEDFARSLMKMGVIGADTPDDQSVQELRDHADQIYRPQGQNPSLNQSMDQFVVLDQQVSSAQEEEESYFELEQTLTQNQENLTQLQEEEEKLKKESMALQLADQQSEADQERVHLGFELAQYNGPQFSEGDQDNWSLLKTNLAFYNSEYEELNPDGVMIMPSGDEETEELEPGVQWMQEHADQLNGMLNQARTYQDQIQSNSQIHDSIVEKRYQEQNLLQALGAESLDELPEDMTPEEREEWQKRQQAIDSRRVFYQNTKAGLQSLMGQSDSLGEERQQISNDYEKFKATIYKYTSTWIRPVGIAFLGTGIIFYAISLLHKSPFWKGAGLPALIIGFLFVVIGSIQQLKGKSYVHREEKAYQLDLRDIDSEKAEIQRQIDNQNQQIKELEEESQQFTEELMAFMQSKGGSEYIMPLVWLQTDYVEKINQLEEEINNLLDQTGMGALSQAYQEEWTSYKQAIQSSYLALDSLYRRFEEDYRIYWDKVASVSPEEQAIKIKTEKLISLNKQIDYLKGIQQNFLDQYGFSTEEELNEAFEIYNEFKKKEERYNFLNENLNHVASELNQSKRPLEELIRENDDRLADVHQRVQSLMEENAKLENQMENMRNSQALQELEQERQNKLDESYDQAVDWASDQLAAQVMQEASVGQGKDTVERVLAQANRYLFDLSNNKFEKLRYTENSVEVYQTLSGDWENVSQLSRGEKALLFVAMRFAFLDAQLGHQDLPILIDEGFAHLDAEYRDNIYRFLKEKSTSRQMIVFTFDESITEGISNEQVCWL